MTRDNRYFIGQLVRLLANQRVARLLLIIFYSVLSLLCICSGSRYRYGLRYGGRYGRVTVCVTLSVTVFLLSIGGGRVRCVAFVLTAIPVMRRKGISSLLDQPLLNERIDHQANAVGLAAQPEGKVCVNDDSAVMLGGDTKKIHPHLE